LAIPATIALFGFFLGQGLERGQLQAKYVEIAIGILKDDQGSISMNKWALSILDKSSPIAIPPDLEESLLKLKLESPQYRTSDSFGDGMPFLEFLSPIRSSGKKFHYIRVDGELMAETPSTIATESGEHEIIWQNSDGNIVCSYQGTFQAWKYSLSCDESNGKVSVILPTKRAEK